MKAEVLYGPGDVRYEDVEEPLCSADGIKVKVIGCGICGSDLRTYGGGSKNSILPAISGHEIVAEVTESYYARFSEGTRLSIAPVIVCGECWYCKKGIQNLCDNIRMIGTAEGIAGGFAEYIAFPKEIIDKGCFNAISKDIDPIDTVIAETASSVLCAQINTNIVMDDLVVVIGAGTIGCLHSEIAKIRGVKEVVIVEMNRDKAELARTQGFDNVVNMSSSDPRLKELVLKKSEGKGADVVISACPAGQAQADAVDLARKRGKVILFGGIHPSSAKLLDTNAIHYKEIMVYGASAYSPEINRKALNLVLNRQLDSKKFITHKYELKDLAQGFVDMRAGKMIKGVIIP